MQSFLDLRFQYSSFKVIQESMAKSALTVADDNNEEHLDEGQLDKLI